MFCSSQDLWNVLNEHFEDNAEFSSTFNRVAARDKTYYTLRTGVGSIWIEIHYIPSECKLYIDLYFHKSFEYYERIKAHKTEILSTINDALDFDSGTKDKSRAIIIDYGFVSPDMDIDKQIELVHWIQEKALLLKAIADKWGIDKDIDIGRYVKRGINIPLKPLGMSEIDGVFTVTCGNCERDFIKAERCPECGQLVLYEQE